MGWFPDEFEACRFPAEPDQVEPPGHELAPGVRVERSGVFALPRRGLLKAAGAAAAVLATGGTLRAQDQDSKGKTTPHTGFEPVTLDAFIAEAEGLANALVKQGEPNEDAYLLHLASLLCRLDATPGFESKGERPVQFRRTHRSPSFAVVQIQMAEGAALPFHDHYEYNGLILGLEGTIHARNFEMVGDELRPPEDNEFLIRETVRSSLTPGRISTLSRRRDNIHDLRAGKGGGRVLDIFTFFPGSKGSKGMEVEKKPVEEGGRVYRARWQRQRRGR